MILYPGDLIYNERPAWLYVEKSDNARRVYYDNIKVATNSLMMILFNHASSTRTLPLNDYVLVLCSNKNNVAQIGLVHSATVSTPDQYVNDSHDQSQLMEYAV